MAGIIAAEAGNGTGIAGIGFAGVSIMPITVLDEQGLGQDSDIIEGIVWAVDHGADVINMSFSNPGFSPALQAAIDYAWANDVVLVAATGNDASSTVTYPAGDRGVIGVSSTDQSDTLAGSSNYGESVFLAAPGEGILSTSPGGGTSLISGTSASTAAVSAAAALLRAVDPAASNGAIVGRLARSAAPAGAVAEVGNGRLDLAQALADAGTDAVQPNGAGPVGNGGPLVGPYVSAARTLEIDDQSVNEGTGAGTTTLNFTIDHNGNGAGSFDWTTAPLGGTVESPDASCDPGEDYRKASGSVIVTTNPWTPPTLSVIVCRDAVIEPNELFEIQFSNVTNGASGGINLPGTTPKGTVNNDDGVQWSVNDVTANEGNSGTTPFTFTITRNGGATLNQSIQYQTGNGTALAGACPANDYNAVSPTTVTFAPADVTKTVAVNVCGNTTPEPNETFFVNLSSASSGTIIDAQGIGTITNDDVAANNPPTDIALSNSTIAENAGANATVGTLSTTDPDAGNTFTYTLVAGTGSADNAAFNISGSTLRANASFNFEVDSSYSVRIRSTDQGGLFFEEPFTITVTNVNEMPTVTLAAANDLVVNEGSSHTYSFTTSDPDSGDSFALLSTSCGLNGSQVGAATFNTTTGAGTFVCSFPDGTVSSSVSVQVEDANGADSNTASQTITILNVAPTITAVTAVPDPVNEGSPTTVTVTATDPAGANDPLTYEFDCNDNGVYEIVQLADNDATCTFDDGPATRTIGVRVTDGDGGADTDTVEVDVDNVAPTATFANGGSVNEGSTGSVSFSNQLDPSAADTTAGFTYSYDFNNDGTFEITGSASDSATVPASYLADGPGSRTVGGRITDKDGGFTDYTTTITILNVAPTITAVTAVPDPVNEGSPTTVTVTATDPAGANDPLTYEFDCNDNGVYEIVQLADNDATCTFDDGPATRTIGVRVTDGDGGADTDTVEVDVDNVAPTATFANGGSVNEGSTGSVSFSNQLDPSAADTTAGFTYSYDFNNDGTFEITGSASDSATVPASYLADGPGSRTVGGRITDKDGGFTDYTTTITILNVAPTITAVTAVPDPVNEGSPTTVTVTATDPAGANDPLTYEFDCNDNGVYEIVQLADNDATCTFDDGPATRTIGVRVTDGDGGADTDTVEVDVDNVAPTATFANGGSVNEGSTGSVSFSNQLDPSAADTTAGFTYSYDFNNDGTFEITGSASDSATVPASYLADGPGSRTVGGRITDKDGGFTDYTTTITILNVAPTITAVTAVPDPVNEGSPTTVTVTATDPAGANDPLTYEFDCNDNGVYEIVQLADNDATCTFDDGPATRTIGVRVTDGDGGADTDTVEVDVDNVAPTATFANGGSVNEGSTGSVSFSNQLDPSAADTTAGFTYSYDFNNDGTFEITGSASDSATVPASYLADGPGSRTVGGRITDKDGGFTDYTTTITILNVAPTITAVTAVPDPVNEGSPTTVTVTATDPAGANDPLTYEFDCNDNGVYEIVQLADNDATCTFDDGPATRTIGVRVTDGDGGADTDTVEVDVDNVAPTATFANGGSVNEGSTGSVSFSNQLDPSAADTTAGFTYSYDFNNDGTFEITGSASDSATVPASYLADGPGSRTVGGRITDKDGGFTDYTTTITILNVAPTITAVTAVPDPVNEGSPTTVTVTATDPAGANDPLTYEFDCNDNGVYEIVQLADNDATCTFDDGPATRTIGVRVTDGDGGADTDTVEVDVDNVAPTATFANGGSVNEGSTGSVSFSNQLDPSAADTTAGFTYSYDFNNDGTFEITGSASDSATVPASYLADGPGSRTVGGRITDKDGGFTDYTTTITILNVAPTITAPVNQTANEGENKGFNLGSFGDPGVNDAPWVVTVSWGDGSANTVFNATNTGSLGPASHSYGDNGTYPVTVTVTDKDTGTSSATFQVTVGNVAPVASNLIVTVDPITGISSATINYSDAGWLDTHTAAFTWNGGLPVGGTVTPTPGSNVRPGPVTGSATATVDLAPGCYQLVVTATITDDNGGSHTVSKTVSNADVYLASFKAPIKDNERNIAKYGNVVPIKVDLASSCTGALTNTPVLHITIALGNATDIEPDLSPVIVAESVSSADTGTQMRINGGGYIYNLTTKNLQQGKDYTIRIRVGSTSGPIIAKALFQPKK